MIVNSTLFCGSASASYFPANCLSGSWWMRDRKLFRSLPILGAVSVLASSEIYSLDYDCFHTAKGCISDWEKPVYSLGVSFFSMEIQQVAGDSYVRCPSCISERRHLSDWVMWVKPTANRGLLTIVCFSNFYCLWCFRVLGGRRNSSSLSGTLMQSASWKRDSVLALEWNNVHLSQENRPVLSIVRQAAAPWVTQLFKQPFFSLWWFIDRHLSYRCAPSSLTYAHTQTHKPPIFERSTPTDQKPVREEMGEGALKGSN